MGPGAPEKLTTEVKFVYGSGIQKVARVAGGDTTSRDGRGPATSGDTTSGSSSSATEASSVR